MTLNILSIGGSDPSSGAGIQSDIKSCQLLGAYCLTVVTGITSQNTTQFGLVEPVSTKILKEQLDMIFSDFKVDIIKIGMVYNHKIIKAIYDTLKEKNIPIVLDPVIRSTTHGMLLTDQALPYFTKYLLPISTVITPNKFEAEFLTNSKIRSKKSINIVAEKLCRMGAKNIIITGLNLDRNHVTDYLLEGQNQHFLSLDKIPGENHGSGCIHSLALCYFMTSNSILDAATYSQRFTYNSIKNSQNIGRGVTVAQPKNDEIYTMLLHGIKEFQKIKNIYKQIPECQTNFVFSKVNPTSTNDVLGIEGRIVRTGKNTMVAGSLKYGGSRHVASTILAVNKKFSKLRSAVNIKFHEDTISLLKQSLIVSSYDRSKEPPSIKNTEGSSILWGIKTAIRASKKQPDAIFHMGDFGKEPMIIIFGSTPMDIIDKLQIIQEHK